MQTTLGMLNTIIEVDLDKTGTQSYDFHMNIYQKSDTAFVTSHMVNCVTKEEILKLSDALRQIVIDN
jgi:hypothetical protein